MNFAYRVVTDPAGRVEYKHRPGGRKHFHLAVSVDEPAKTIDHIRLVEYRLHETFREPIRHNDDRASQFTEHFFTWGKFMIFVTVLFIDGSREQFSFFLDYSLPPDLGLNYIQLPVE